MKSFCLRIFGLALLLGLTAGVSAEAQQMMLEKAVVSSGGGRVSNSQTTLDYTLGQPVTGSATNGTTNGTFGFWSNAFIASSVTTGAGAGTVTTALITPNPASSETRLQLTLARQSNVVVTLHDVNGRLLSTLFEGEREAGSVSLPLNVEGLASGTYYVAIAVPGALLQKKLTVVQ